MRRFLPPYPYSPALFRHGGRPTAGEDNRLDFSANINPLGPPRSALQAIARAWGGVASYPDPECRPLSDLLAARHQVEPAQVLIGNGSNELIYLISRAWKPRRVAIVEPTYTEYLRASLLVGAEVDHWLPEEEAFQPQPFDPGAAELVWLCQPNNPTGQLWPAGTLAGWVEAHPRVLFVVDEAFLPFLPEEAEYSMIPALRRLPNLVVLRSLTKFYALPGLRIGYA
ncbi:MAG: aminotransferase class I/II-fold pyridoxal phosphate-dependent enzyme, partial [Planctomycetes bacterium]|nr:aminotransferase class I/II-fold pyridoxal phosphate-dependent enzyme [Planctomycetota bacterium]